MQKMFHEPRMPRAANILTVGSFESIYFRDSVKKHERKKKVIWVRRCLRCGEDFKTTTAYYRLCTICRAIVEKIDIELSPVDLPKKNC